MGKLIRENLKGSSLKGVAEKGKKSA